MKKAYYELVLERETDAWGPVFRSSILKLKAIMIGYLPVGSGGVKSVDYGE